MLMVLTVTLPLRVAIGFREKARSLSSPPCSIIFSIVTAIVGDGPTPAESNHRKEVVQNEVGCVLLDLPRRYER